MDGEKLLLRSVDAIHVATAVQADVPVLQAYDKAFFRAKNEIGTLIIQEPTCNQWMLDLAAEDNSEPSEEPHEETEISGT
jgi:hypothetical protein